MHTQAAPFDFMTLRNLPQESQVRKALKILGWEGRGAADWGREKCSVP